MIKNYYHESQRNPETGEIDVEIRFSVSLEEEGFVPEEVIPYNMQYKNHSVDHLDLYNVLEWTLENKIGFWYEERTDE